MVQTLVLYTTQDYDQWKEKCMQAASYILAELAWAYEPRPFIYAKQTNNRVQFDIAYL